MPGCRKCGHGTPERGKLTCETCLNKQRMWQKQYNERVKSGTVGKLGRPASDQFVLRLDSAPSSHYDELPSYPIQEPLINQRVFSAMAMIAERYMPGRNAEPLVHELLEAGFKAARSDTIQKVSPEGP